MGRHQHDGRAQHAGEPRRRSSVVGAFKFASAAFAPLIWLALYNAYSWVAFAVAGLASAAIVPALGRARGAPEPPVF